MNEFISQKRDTIWASIFVSLPDSFSTPGKRPPVLSDSLVSFMHRKRTHRVTVGGASVSDFAARFTAATTNTSAFSAFVVRPTR